MGPTDANAGGRPPEGPPGERRWGGLLLRVASAAVLIPPVMAALYYGSPYTEALVLAAGGLIAWEWARLCGGGRLGAGGLAVILSVLIALAVGVLRIYPVAGWLVATGALAAALVATRWGPGRPHWYALGVAYAALPCIGFLWLRQLPDDGRAVVFWLLLVVWATDIGAYGFGRLIGGPKLAPQTSPKKTWAGLAGGVLCAGLVGAGLAWWWQGAWAPASIAGLSVLLALAAQTGDLFESAMKRHFGVKDASQLIPGHGGLMDRLDGLLAASLVVSFLTWLRGFVA